MSIKLSICIPTYNRAKCLRECLNSVLSSISGNEDQVEIVISDNASTDETGDIVRAFQETHPLIRYQRNDRNIGAERNFYAVASIASGEYIWIFSDDDKMELDAIAIVLRKIEEQYYLIVNNYSIWTKDFCFLKKRHAINWRGERRYDDANELMKDWGVHLDLVSSVIIKKEIFFKTSFSDYDRYSEYGMSFMYAIYDSAIDHCHAVFVDRPIFRFRSGNSGHYFDWYKYFVVGSTMAFDELETKGYTKSAVQAAKARTLRELVIPQMLYMKLGTPVDRNIVLKLTLPLYKKELLFWIKGIPALYVPASSVRFAKRLVGIFRRLRR